MISHMCAPTISGEVRSRQTNPNYCEPLVYDGDKVMTLMDGNDNTCMPDAVDSNVQLTLKVSAPHALQVIKIRGFNLSCSPSRGWLVQNNPHCRDGTTCQKPHEVCHSQHGTFQWGTQGMIQCSYLCKQRNRDGLTVIRHVATGDAGPQLCEISVE